MLSSILWDILISVAKIYLLYRIVRTIAAFIWAVLIYCLAPLIYQPNLTKFTRRWTVITGGTDGIGKAYLLELARRGFNKFVLIGRNEEKLKEVAILLESNCTKQKANVKLLQFDFSCDDYECLRDFLKPIDIGFLLNCHGVGPKTLTKFGENPNADRLIYKVNTLGTIELMSAILPPMISHGGGQIVNISSSQAYRPIPLVASYCASKSMISFLSEAIDREQPSINVQCLTPALVATKMTLYSEVSMFVMSPENFARQAVGTLGLVTTTSGCFNHEIQLLIRHLFPWRLLKHLITPIYEMHRKRLDDLHELVRFQMEEHTDLQRRRLG